MAGSQPWGGSYATERKRVAWLVFAAGLLLWYLLPRLELELARARWQSHGIEDYHITAEGYSHGTWFCLDSYTLAVQDGELRKVEGTPVPEGGLSPSIALCPGTLTVAQAFERVKIGTYIPNSPLLWQRVRYDRTYGFVRAVYSDCLNPLLSPYCESDYIVTHFRPVTPGSE